MIGIFHTKTLTQIGKKQYQFRSSADAQLAIDGLSHLFSKGTLEAAEIGEIEFRKTMQELSATSCMPRRGRPRVVRT